jgi:hypothetical protein
MPSAVKPALTAHTYCSGIRIHVDIRNQGNTRHRNDLIGISR